MSTTVTTGPYLRYLILWTISTLAAAQDTVVSGGDGSTDVSFQNVSTRNCLRFDISGCSTSSAEVVLSSTSTPTDPENYRFFIDDDSQTVTLAYNGATVAESFGSIESNCATPQSYWLTWFAGTVILGKGTVIGENRVIIYNGVRRISPMFMFVKGDSTDFILRSQFNSDSTCQYTEVYPDYGQEVCDFKASNIEAVLLDYQTFGFSAYGYNHMKFALQACSAATIYLYRAPTEKSYEFQFDKQQNLMNLNTFVLSDSTREPRYSTPPFNGASVDYCASPQRFWISWRNGKVSSGNQHLINRQIYDYVEFDLADTEDISSIGYFAPAAATFVNISLCYFIGDQFPTSAAMTTTSTQATTTTEATTTTTFTTTAAIATTTTTMEEFTTSLTSTPANDETTSTTQQSTTVHASTTEAVEPTSGSSTPAAPETTASETPSTAVSTAPSTNSTATATTISQSTESTTQSTETTKLNTPTTVTVTTIAGSSSTAFAESSMKPTILIIVFSVFGGCILICAVGILCCNLCLPAGPVITLPPEVRTISVPQPNFGAPTRWYTPRDYFGFS